MGENKMEHFVVEKVWLREMARNVAAQITPYNELQYKCDATEAWDNWKIEVEGLFNFHILFLLFNMSNERLELKYFLFYISFQFSFASYCTNMLTCCTSWAIFPFEFFPPFLFFFLFWENVCLGKRKSSSKSVFNRCRSSSVTKLFNGSLRLNFEVWKTY